MADFLWSPFGMGIWVWFVPVAIMFGLYGAWEQKRGK